MSITQTNIVRHQPAYIDTMGDMGTALAGATQWTPTAYRNTGIVLNELASGDVFTQVMQMNHWKQLGSNAVSFHLHFIPKAAQNGNIAFTYTWGWYNNGDTVPDTLPNSGTVADIALQTTDQYKILINTLISNLAAPANETYSSFLMIRIVAAAPAAGTNRWTAGGTNRIAIVGPGADAHILTDRFGSYNEATD